jgi:tetratricopeptide (TPR) repeat protein
MSNHFYKIFLLSFLFIFCSCGKLFSPVNDNNAITAAESIIKEEALIAPSTAKFTNEKVIEKKEGLFLVQVTADAQNIYGVYIREYYLVILEFTSGGKLGLGKFYWNKGIAAQKFDYPPDQDAVNMAKLVNGWDTWKLKEISNHEPTKNSKPKAQKEILNINAGNPVELEDGVSKIQAKLAEYPKDPMLWYSLGQLYFYKHDTTQAIAMFKKSILLDLKDTTALLVIGTDILCNGNDNELAAQAFKKLILQSPHNGHAYKMLGATYAAMNKHQESIEYNEKAADLNPSDPSAYIQISANYYRLGEFDKAIIAIKKAIITDPNLIEAKWYLGCYYSAMDNFSDARRIFHDILRDKKTTPDVKYLVQLGLADIFISEDDFNSALKLLNAIPDDDSIIVGSKYMQLGSINEKQNHIDIARLYYLRSANSSNQMIGAFVNLGRMLVKNGKTQEGYLYLQKAKESDPSLGAMAYKRGLLLYSKGKTKQATKSFERASLLDNADAKQWLKDNSHN